MSSARSRIDLDKVTPAEASQLRSEEHKRLGYPPPSGSFSSTTQSAASRNLSSLSHTSAHNTTLLKQAAQEDAQRINRFTQTAPQATRSELSNVQVQGVNPTQGIVREGIDYDELSGDDVRQLMSEEHRQLGYRPPKGSLAAEAQSYVNRQENWEREAAGGGGGGGGGGGMGMSESEAMREERIRDAAQRDAARVRAEQGGGGWGTWY